jgi:hypothetical protein
MLQVWFISGSYFRYRLLSVFYGLFILSSDHNEVGYEYVSWMELAQNCI